ncbi:tRNA lysidine(34) synthetase TilS [Acinetobacter rathckeae]|uniref:tRNA lysidine(34) synthetase TilS n=1 Tax=Acinetobacter rathckeae TaxID=2605272 RepID=UPI0018A276B7|nr:tRNA lysidine(34) synthetase TilS [Acinetobacter rathckeae]MBF7686778.1 tRNA lysidine(34) synthetase TilS [Acinetobacter rathckeae]
MRSTLSTFNEVWQRESRIGFLAVAESVFAEKDFLIGCSGGMDSMLLLHLFYCLFPNRVRAIYVDHQLQSISTQWGEQVSDYCTQLGVSCACVPVQVKSGNLEAEARNARYAAFNAHIQENEVLVLAHHEQDQAETVLLNLFSGAGVSGLSAMKPIDCRDDLRIWRPFLRLSREKISQWTHALNLPYVNDPTNLDTHYDRAWARSMLWPVLSSRFPHMQAAVSRTALLMQDAEDILNDIVSMDLKQCVTANRLDLKQYQSLSLARQRQMLSVWLKAQEVYRPSYALVERLQQEVIYARADAQAALFCKPFWYVRFGHFVYQLMPTQYLAKQYDQIDPKMTVQLQQSMRCQLLSGSFDVQATQNMGLSWQLLGKKLDLTQRVGGEKVHLYGRVGHWPLKKAIQQAEIFPWLRHRVQILQSDGVILGVFTPHGFWLADSKFCEPCGWLPVLVQQ